MSKVYLEHRDAFHVPGAASEEEIAAALQLGAEALADCDNWIISAGAGMGVDSGLPDFRGSSGLWKDRSLAMTYEEMSDDKWFTEDPCFAWGVNYTQLALYRQTVPHEGFAAVSRWAEYLGKPYYVFTSNIDGQFEKAGFSEERIALCHGDIHHVQCTDRKCRGVGGGGEADLVWSADCLPTGLETGIDRASLRLSAADSLDAAHFRCPRCDKLARPNIWFCHDANYVPRKQLIETRNAYNKWVFSSMDERKRIVVVECGGGMAIPSVRVEGEDAVAGGGEGSLLIRINPSDCRVPAERGVGIPLGARAGLERLEAALSTLLKTRAAASAGGAPKTAKAKPRGASPASKRKASPASRAKASGLAPSRRQGSPAPQGGPKK